MAVAAVPAVAVVLAVAGQAAFRAVEDAAQDAHVALQKRFKPGLDARHAHRVLIDDVNRGVDALRDHGGIRDQPARRRIDQNAVVRPFEPVQHLLHVIRAHVLPVGFPQREDQQGYAGLLVPEDAVGFAVFRLLHRLRVHIQRFKDAGVADIPVDQQHLFAHIRNGERQIRCDGRFALARSGAGDQNGFDLVLLHRVDHGVAQQTERLHEAAADVRVGPQDGPVDLLLVAFERDPRERAEHLLPEHLADILLDADRSSGNAVEQDPRKAEEQPYSRRLQRVADKGVFVGRHRRQIGVRDHGEFDLADDVSRRLGAFFDRAPDHVVDLLGIAPPAVDREHVRPGNGRGGKRGGHIGKAQLLADRVLQDIALQDVGERGRELRGHGAVVIEGIRRHAAVGPAGSRAGADREGRGGRVYGPVLPIADNEPDAADHDRQRDDQPPVFSESLDKIAEIKRYELISVFSVFRICGLLFHAGSPPDVIFGSAGSFRVVGGFLIGTLCTAVGVLFY